LKINNKALEQELLLSKLNNAFPERNSDKSEHSNEEQSNNNNVRSVSEGDMHIICLINKINPPRWYTKVHVVINKDYAFDVVAMIDTGADLNCIQEGLIPSKYFEKSMEKVSSANSEKMLMNFELNNVHVCQHNICFHTPCVLLKNMTEKIILGIPFIAMHYPFIAELDGVSTVVMGVPIKFQFASKFEIDMSRMNLISAKVNHLNFLQ
jgi:hypothetical protein